MSDIQVEKNCIVKTELYRFLIYNEIRQKFIHSKLRFFYIILELSNNFLLSKNTLIETFLVNNVYWKIFNNIIFANIIYNFTANFALFKNNSLSTKQIDQCYKNVKNEHNFLRSKTTNRI